MFGNSIKSLPVILSFIWSLCALSCMTGGGTDVDNPVIQGTTVSITGDTISGVFVVIHYVSDSSTVIASDTAITDSSGNFKFEPVAKSDFTIRAFGDSLVAIESQGAFRSILNSPQANYSIILDAPLQVTFTIMHDSLSPSAKAIAFAEIVGTDIKATADSNGVLLLWGVPQGEYDIAIFDTDGERYVFHFNYQDGTCDPFIIVDFNKPPDLWEKGGCGPVTLSLVHQRAG